MAAINVANSLILAVPASGVKVEHSPPYDATLASKVTLTVQVEDVTGAALTTSTAELQGSNDGATWFPLLVGTNIDIGTPGNPAPITGLSTGAYAWVRVEWTLVEGTASGTAQVTVTANLNLGI